MHNHPGQIDSSSLQRSAALWLLFSLLALSQAPVQGHEIELWNGTIKKGTVTFAVGRYHVDTAEGKQTLARTDVFEVRLARPERRSATRPTRITLTDGSHLTGVVQPTIKMDSLGFERPGGITLTFPGAQIREIEFGPLDTGAQPSATPDEPHVIMRNGRVVPCKPLWFTFLELGAESAAGSLRLRKDQMHRLVLQPKAKTTLPRDADVWVKTLLGDTVAGQLLSLDAKALQLRCGWGEMRLDAEDVFSISSISPKVMSLVRLKPKAVKETAFLDFIRPHRVNTNLFGGSLVLHGVRFDRGLAVHARTQLDYKLGGAYQRFVVTVGLDTTLTDRGDAVFAVLGDGKPLKTVPLTGRDGIRHLSVPVQGVQVLELLLDYGKGGSSGDHGIWANPRLIR